ncbi:MAG: hypothetical protein DRN05_02720 [Thermoplasmata archaeon]|nr:MAG: hypothetical protein DRN05_02720 [Thermoplasmata archaeon]
MGKVYKELSGYIVGEFMGDKIVDLEEEMEISRMFLDRKDPDSLSEELAFFMHRFNLDMDTVETMPAFEEHLKPLFALEEKK